MTVNLHHNWQKNIYVCKIFKINDSIGIVTTGDTRNINLLIEEFQKKIRLCQSKSKRWTKVQNHHIVPTCVKISLWVLTVYTSNYLGYGIVNRLHANFGMWCNRVIDSNWLWTNRIKDDSRHTLNHFSRVYWTPYFG